MKVIYLLLLLSQYAMASQLAIDAWPNFGPIFGNTNITIVWLTPMNLTNVTQVDAVFHIAGGYDFSVQGILDESLATGYFESPSVPDQGLVAVSLIAYVQTNQGFLSVPAGSFSFAYEFPAILKMTPSECQIDQLQYVSNLSFAGQAFNLGAIRDNEILCLFQVAATISDLPINPFDPSPSFLRRLTTQGSTVPVQMNRQGRPYSSHIVTCPIPDLPLAALYPVTIAVDGYLLQPPQYFSLVPPPAASVLTINLTSILLPSSRIKMLVINVSGSFIGGRPPSVDHLSSYICSFTFEDYNSQTVALEVQYLSTELVSLICPFPSELMIPQSILLNISADSGYTWSASSKFFPPQSNMTA